MTLKIETFRPSTIWLTGLAASGKTTLAEKLKDGLNSRGMKNVVLLDGEAVREQLNLNNYSTEDRNLIGIRKAELALEYNKKGDIVIITGIAHHRATREKIRGMFERYYEVYLDCEADACAKRDYKGHYEKAYAGKYEHFVGVTEPYEVSDETELVLKTGEMPVADCAGILLDHVWNFIKGNSSKKV